MNSDFSDLLLALNEESAEYMIVGGYAVIKYTEPRFTKDIDIWVNATPENAERVLRALKRFGAPLGELSAIDLTNPDHFFQIGVAPTRIDIIVGIDGRDFDDCWPRRTPVVWDDIQTNFISIHDLIANKLASGRPQDLMDAANLKSALEIVPPLTNRQHDE